MAKRQSTGKRLRFEVFKRDGFTCQYCGSQPPAVVLVADHIDAVAIDGATTIDNLITACEPCNQGKGARPLGQRIIRPDADLLYLEAQQEIAELRRFQAAAAEREVLLDGAVETLQELWLSLSRRDWTLPDAYIRSLVVKYGVDVAYDAVSNVAGKVGGGYLSTDYEGYRRYLGAVAKNMAEGV